MGEEWKVLPNDQKVRFQEEADRAKENYRREMRAFKDK
jgi:hypothetical protein